MFSLIIINSTVKIRRTARGFVCVHRQDKQYELCHHLGPNNKPENNREHNKNTAQHKDGAAEMKQRGAADSGLTLCLQVTLCACRKKDGNLSVSTGALLP